MSIHFGGFQPAPARFGCSAHNSQPAFGNKKAPDTTDPGIRRQAQDLRFEIKEAIQAHDGINGDAIRKIVEDNRELLRASFKITDLYDAYPIGQIILREAALLPQVSAEAFGHILTTAPANVLFDLSREFSGQARHLMQKDDLSLDDEILLDKLAKIDETARRQAANN